MTAVLDRPARRRPPSRTPGWPPRWLTPVPLADRRRGDGELYADLIEAVCRVTKDSIGGTANELLVLRPWQRQLLTHLLARRADGHLRHRTALVGMARKNGKSGLGAGIAVGSLLLGPEGGEVYSCAADRKQAGIVFEDAKRMVELEPELQRVVKVYRDALVVPSTNSTYRALSAEAFTKEGLNPHAVIFDEVHAQPTRELWDVMALAMGARWSPLMLGITTAGVRNGRDGGPSLCHQLYEYGRSIALGETTDPTFFMAWWEPSAGAQADHRDPRTWREANPGFDDLVSAADFEATVNRTPENEFRTKRTNVFVSSATTWLPHGAWDALADDERYLGGPPAGTKVVLGFDGSKTNDSTALIGVTVEDRPHVWVVGLWERPPATPDWSVPRAEVAETIRKSCRTWDVVEIAWDDYMWQDAREELQAGGAPIEVFPQSPARMGPATQRFYEAVIDRAITHDGDTRMARQVGNAVPRPTSAGGQRISKENKNSKAWIDGAVAAVMALTRAEWHHAHPTGDDLYWGEPS